MKTLDRGLENSPLSIVCMRATTGKHGLQLSSSSFSFIKQALAGFVLLSKLDRLTYCWLLTCLFS